MILIKVTANREIEITIPGPNLLIKRDIETNLDHHIIIIKTLAKDQIEAKDSNEVSEEGKEEKINNAGIVSQGLISRENALNLREMIEEVEVEECVMNLEAWTEIDLKPKG